jgi:hypothetical protein
MVCTCIEPGRLEDPKCPIHGVAAMVNDIAWEELRPRAQDVLDVIDAMAKQEVRLVHDSKDKTINFWLCPICMGIHSSGDDATFPHAPNCPVLLARVLKEKLDG